MSERLRKHWGWGYEDQHPSPEQLGVAAQAIRERLEESFEIHAGATYRDFGLTAGLQQAGAVVAVPPLGLTQGEQLRLYRDGPPR